MDANNFDINTVRIIPNIVIDGETLTFEQFRDRLGELEFENAKLKADREKVAQFGMNNGLSWLERQISANQAEIEKLKDLYLYQVQQFEEEFTNARNEGILGTNIDAYAKREKIKTDYMRAFPHTQLTRDILDGKDVDMNEIIKALKEAKKLSEAQNDIDIPTNPDLTIDQDDNSLTDNTDIILSPTRDIDFQPDNETIKDYIDLGDKTEVRSLESILHSVTLDKDGQTLDLSKKERRNTAKSRISITNNLKQRVAHKNLIYNAFGAFSSVLPGAAQFISKMKNKIFTAFHKEAVENHDQIVENLYNLSDNDLEVLRTELTANKATELRSYVAIMPLVTDRLKVYIEEKYCKPLREEITQVQVDLMNRYGRVQELNIMLSQAQSEETRTKIMESIKEISLGSADKVALLKDLKLKLDQNINGGPGIHMLDETSKAVDNNQADKGKFFSTKIRLADAEEFNRTEAILGDALVKAVNSKDDYAALTAFGQKEIFEYESTMDKDTLIGELSVGNYNWKAMPESVDYGTDPLLGYILTTASTVALFKGIANEIHNAQLKSRIEEVDAKNLQVNAHNKQVQDQIHQTGRDLEGRSGDYIEGAKAMSNDSIIGTRTAGEYNAGDASNWDFNSSTYTNLDNASHAQGEEMMSQYETGFESIQQGISSGSMTAEQAVHSAQEIFNNMNAQKQAMFEQFRQTISSYAPAHPQFDYDALTKALDNAINNPEAIGRMMDGMAESVKAGKSLQEATFEAAETVMGVGAPVALKPQLGLLITQTLLTGHLGNRLHQMQSVSKSPRAYNEQIEQSIVNAINNNLNKHDLLPENTEIGGKAR